MTFGGIDTRWVPSTLRGFRQWILTAHTRGHLTDQITDVSLRSLNRTFWSDAKLTAECHRESHTAPNKDCLCGIYSLGFPEEYRSGSVRQMFPPKITFSSMYINGVTKNGGKVQFGTLGFRAQYVAIEAMHLPPPTTEPEFQLRETFKKQYPNILVFSNIDSMYEQYPEDDLRSLYPPEVHDKIIVDRMKWQAEKSRARQPMWALVNYPGKIIDI